jgi:hypothetical protein
MVGTISSHRFVASPRGMGTSRFVKEMGTSRSAPMTTILQIADLHRSTADPVSNEQLVATIVREHDRAKALGMPKVEVIVVAGDVVQGCGLASQNYADELRSQYGVAAGLLRQLADELLSGDLKRLVVVPGNHDVCWNTAVSAMKVASPAEQTDAYKLLVERGSPFRWDWKQRVLYRIDDEPLYVSRLQPFREFFRNLYGGTPPEVVDDRAWIHEVDELTFVGFDSCLSTDCFNHSAEISADSISRVARRLRGRSSLLRIGVWHHSIDGPPMVTDYLDSACIRQLAYHGFRLGLHGHQHFASTAPVYIHTGQEQVMAIVSTGSLCAGKRELPPGRLRGFNFIRVEATQRKATVSSLAMDLEARVQPEYAFNGGSSDRTISWTANDVDSQAAEFRKVMDAAESSFKSGDHEAAVRLLQPRRAMLDTYGSAILFESILESDDPGRAVEILGESLSAAQATRVVGRMIELGRTTEAASLLDRYGEQMVSDAVTNFRLRIKIDPRRAGRG